MPEQPATTSALEYESPRDPRALRIERAPDGTVTITVPTCRTAFGYASDIARRGPVGFVLSPFAYALFKFVATKRPRAVFRVTSSDLNLLETSDSGLGLHETTRSWPLADIGELRRNRYERGVWMTIVGRDGFNLLLDVTEPMITAVANALAEARQPPRVPLP